jgi:F1F0 ATPase subunit 2
MFDFSIMTGLLTLLSGTVLGILYFGGLWLTLQKITQQKHVIGYGLLSYLVRMTMLGFGLYFIMQIGWIYLFSAFLGFLLARTLMISRLKPSSETG